MRIPSPMPQTPGTTGPQLRHYRTHCQCGLRRHQCCCPGPGPSHLIQPDTSRADVSCPPWRLRADLGGRSSHPAWKSTQFKQGVRLSSISLALSLCRVLLVSRYSLQNSASAYSLCTVFTPFSGLKKRLRVTVSMCQVYTAENDLLDVHSSPLSLSTLDWHRRHDCSV